MHGDRRSADDPAVTQVPHVGKSGRPDNRSCSGTRWFPSAVTGLDWRAGQGPSARVVQAFGLLGAPERLPGGQGQTWRLGDAALKPSQGEDVVRWAGDLLTRLDGRCDFRVSPPLRARDGSWSVEGWTAWRYQPGAHQPGSWLGILDVGSKFHDSVHDEALPTFLLRRTDRWAVTDRVAWDELPLPPAMGSNSLVRELVAALRPVRARSQLVHADLTGNVLFHPRLPGDPTTPATSSTSSASSAYSNSKSKPKPTPSRPSPPAA